MDFKNAQELIALCEERNLPISEIMRIREIELGETTAEAVKEKMTRVLEIMREAARSPIEKPVKSMGGLIGGEARKLNIHSQEKKLKNLKTSSQISLYTTLPKLKLKTIKN